MGSYQGTKNFLESDDIETAYFFPSYHNDGVVAQAVAVAPMSDRETSIIVHQFFDDGNIILCKLSVNYYM